MGASYTAVVLDERSRQRLINRFNKIIPQGWEVVADHMTMNLGDIDPEFEQYISLPVHLDVNSIAMDDKVIAVGITGVPSKNNQPHITLAVNRANGGKPMMSNNLTNWKPLDRPLKLRGKVTEVMPFNIE